MRGRSDHGRALDTGNVTGVSPPAWRSSSGEISEGCRRAAGGTGQACVPVSTGAPPVPGGDSAVVHALGQTGVGESV